MGLFLHAHAQGTFNKRYDAFGWGRPQDGWGIELTSMGYALISASFDADSISPDSSLYHASVLLTRIDQAGNKLSEVRSYIPDRGTYAGWSNCCDTIPGGGFVVGGSTETLDGTDAVRLLRLDDVGDTLWTKEFGGSGQFWIGEQVKYTRDGGSLVVGGTDATGYIDGFAIKTDAFGNEQWRHTYGWSATLSDGFVSCELGPASSYYLGGTRVNSPTDTDFWVQLVDSLGAMVWRTSWGGSWDDGAAQISMLANGHVLVASGWGYAADGEAMRPYLAELDSADGSLIWDREFGAITYSTLLFAGKQAPDGDLIACGVSYLNSDQHGLLLHTNSQGDSLWMRTYFYVDTLMSDGTGRFYDVLPTNDGGFIAAGSAYHSATLGYPAGYSQDTWVVKVDGQGCLIPGCDGVDITEQATNLLDAITLFPNPATSHVTVRLDLPTNIAGAPLQLSLVSTDGRVVHQETISSGVGSFNLSLTNVNAGLYAVHITNGTTWLTGAKLIVE